MELEQAIVYATGIQAKLAPYCERIEIAGSIRRKKANPRDIEIVCIPKKQPVGLFGDERETDARFVSIVNGWPKVRGEPTGRYTQRIIDEGIKLDLFMVEAGNWGLQFAIRTGSAAFSHKFLASRWAVLGYKSSGGYLYKNNERFEIREEKDLFELLAVRWMDPECRH